MTATKMLYRLNPVTPFAPNVVNIQPPTIAPMIPRMTSRKKPSPLLLTILLPINPAISPTTIHAIIPIAYPPMVSGCYINITSTPDSSVAQCDLFVPHLGYRFGTAYQRQPLFIRRLAHTEVYHLRRSKRVVPQIKCKGFQ